LYFVKVSVFSGWMQKAKHLEIQGLVQGVRYRDTMVEQATRLQVTGWVRNKKNGFVEAVVQGSEENIQTLLQWCHRGPAHARVDKIVISDQPLDSTIQHFRRLPTEGEK